MKQNYGIGGISMEYKQVKVWIDSEIAAAFKTACTKSGVSMAHELSHFMAEHTDLLGRINKKKDGQIKNRGWRRKEVEKVIPILDEIRDLEEYYKDNVPENLQSGPAYSAAEETIDILDQAIDLLREAY